MASRDDRQRAEAVLRRRLGDSFSRLTAQEKTELVAQLMRRPRR
jgi:hypothetical protein